MADDRLHSIEFVICKCGFYYKLEDSCDELSLNCTYCDRVIECDFGLTTDGPSIKPGERCPDCYNTRRYSAEYKELYDNEMNEWVSKTLLSRTDVLKHISNKLNNDTELVHKLIQDIIYLENTIDILQMQIAKLKKANTDRCSTIEYPFGKGFNC